MKIIVINGPNLNKLGKRDKNQYGELTLTELETKIHTEYQEIDFTFFQSNVEGEICKIIQDAERDYDGVIINPGGFTHTSVAIRDAIEISSLPIIEAHLSNISARETFRKTQITSSKASGYISGFKENSYLAAVYILKKIIQSHKSQVAV